MFFTWQMMIMGVMAYNMHACSSNKMEMIKRRIVINITIVLEEGVSCSMPWYIESRVVFNQPDTCSIHWYSFFWSPLIPMWNSLHKAWGSRSLHVSHLWSFSSSWDSVPLMFAISCINSSSAASHPFISNLQQHSIRLFKSRHCTLPQVHFPYCLIQWPLSQKDCWHKTSFQNTFTLYIVHRYSLKLTFHRHLIDIILYTVSTR